MSDHDTISSETDDAIRARLGAFAQEITARTDAAVALERLPRRSAPSTVQLITIAACLLAIAAVVAVVMSRNPTVDTLPPSAPPPTDGVDTIAKGEGVELVGEGPNTFGGSTLDIDVRSEGGRVTGEYRWYAEYNGSVFDVEARVECADTRTDGIVIVGGRLKPGEADQGTFAGLVIREGDPDSVAPIRSSDGATCSDVLQTGRDMLGDETQFVDVEGASDIRTG